MQISVRVSFGVFDELESRGEVWNVYQYMLKLASQTIGKFSSNMDFHHFDDIDSPLHPFVLNTASLLAPNKKVTARGEWYRYLPSGDPAKLTKVHSDLYSMINEAIQNVRSKDTSDLPMEEVALKASCVVDYLNRAVHSQGEKLPLDLVLANMVIVTGAGFTTTSSLFSWLIYFLVMYERHQERLYEELIEHGITNTMDWDPDHTSNLPFLDNFIKETQRLHNPSFQVSY
jgi:cytochrome P450